ncbi:MAG: HAMP domain-containing histidine kinase [Fusobacterium sp.]|nr:HAMP domain-containing histidine kinase [Fusobacterium sp.]
MKDKNIYHEIKNQISVCDLYTEIVRRTLDKKGIEDETLTRAIKNIKNSLALIADCASSLREVRLQELSLANLVDESIEICKAYKEISFDNEIPTATVITADKNKFTSALVNIIKNAIEAGATEVKIYTHGADILIENNGDPIPPAVREKIFTDGFTTKENGSGFGLMLTQKTLEEQGFILSLEAATDVTIFNISRK